MCVFSTLDFPVILDWLFNVNVMLLDGLGWDESVRASRDVIRAYNGIFLL
jgi:hypothetical protein